MLIFRAIFLLLISLLIAQVTQAEIIDFALHRPTSARPERKSNAQAMAQFERWVLSKAPFSKHESLRDFAKHFLRAKGRTDQLHIFKLEFNRHMILIGDERRAILWASSLLDSESYRRLDERMRLSLLNHIYSSMRYFEHWDELTREQYQKLWTLILEGTEQVSLKILERVIRERIEPWHHALYSMESVSPLYWVYKQYELEVEKVNDDLVREKNHGQQSLWHDTLFMMLQPQLGLRNLAQNRLLSDLLTLLKLPNIADAVKRMQLEVVSYIAQNNTNVEQTLRPFLYSENPGLRFSALLALQKKVGEKSPQALEFLYEVMHFTNLRIAQISHGEIPGQDHETLEMMMWGELALRQTLTLRTADAQPKPVEVPLKTCQVILLRPEEPKAP